MLEAMYDVHGLGLAAPQVGVQKRIFVYDLYEGDGPQTIINPTLSEFDGEWTFDEGCLSIPGLYFPITRPKEVLLTGFDLDGNEVSIEADELLARAFQHELDHLDGTLLLEHLDADQRKAALRELRQRDAVYAVAYATRLSRFARGRRSVARSTHCRRATKSCWLSPNPTVVGAAAAS